MPSWKQIQGDLFGASAAAAVTVPLALAYGLVVYGSLGPDFAGQAVLAGVYCAVFAGLAAALLGGTPVQITGLNAALTLAMASLLGGLTVSFPLIGPAADQAATLVALLSLVVFLAGAMQAVFGLVGLGNLVKYVPYPVVTGFLNGIGVVLIINQTGRLAGVLTWTQALGLQDSWTSLNPWPLVVGFGTAAVVILSRRFLKNLPEALVGMVAGTGLHHLLAAAGAARPGPVIGAVSFRFPGLEIPQAWGQLFQIGDIWGVMPQLLAASVVMALVGSAESLLSSLACDYVTGERHDSRRELLGQGAGNMVAALAGGLAAAGSASRSQINLRAGGHSRLSGVLHSGVVLAAMAVLGPWLDSIPLAAVAGLVIAVGAGIFNGRPLSLGLRALTSRSRSREPLGDAFVVLLVMLVTLLSSITVAVIWGFLVSSVLFVTRMSASTIRRQYSVGQVRSKKMRSLTHSTLLDNFGDRIVVYELQGALFFGSSDRLVRELEDHLLGGHVLYGVVDFKNVTHLDSTGAAILVQTVRKMDRTGKFVILSHLAENPRLADTLELLGLREELGGEHLFPDLDTALEYVEDQVLEKVCNVVNVCEISTLDQMDATQGMTPPMLAALRDRLSIKTFSAGERIIKEGDTNRDLYFLVTGSVSVKILLPGSTRMKRLITFSPGVVLGEMALLDGSPRSADVWADEDCSVLCLSHADFLALGVEQPELVTRLVINLARILSERVRGLSREVGVLEQS
ncbi:MAG: cyclic nucleotide-binding domain-containing protein [Deltaproteobacteria bacterium]|nr:cyclic nucleotide-binding domain-containing protein [Deltaproteobacteria bacterium]